MAMLVRMYRKDDHGITAFLCVTCKTDIRLRGYNHPLNFCPQCGVEFSVGIPAKEPDIRRWTASRNQARQMHLQWDILSRYRSHVDGEMTDWRPIQDWFVNDRHGALAKKRELLSLDSQWHDDLEVKIVCKLDT